MLAVKLLKESAIVPTRSTEESAGYDLYSASDYLIEKGTRCLCSTGISLNIPKGSYVQLKSRSGMAVKGIDVGAGVIDSDYTGEIKVLLINHHYEGKYIIKAGDRIAQMIHLPIIVQEKLTIIEGENKQTERGDKGFGSSGI